MIELEEQGEGWPETSVALAEITVEELSGTLIGIPGAVNWSAVPLAMGAVFFRHARNHNPLTRK